MENTVGALRPLLYELLEMAVSNSQNDVNMTQQLGVSMTNAVKKDGVQIVQIQALHLQSIVPKIVQMMKVVDCLQTGNGGCMEIEASSPQPVLTMQPAQMQVEDQRYRDGLEQFCLEALNANRTLKDVQDELRARYIEHAWKKHGSLKKASEALGTSPSTYYQAKRRVGDEEDGGPDKIDEREVYGPELSAASGS